MKRLMLIFLLVSLTGCIEFDTIQSGRPVLLTIEVSPSEVFAGNEVTVYFDVENSDIKTIENVVAEVFDPDRFEGNSCESVQIADEMEPDSIDTASCTLVAPSADDLIEQTTRTSVQARINFDTVFSAVHPVEVISLTEYDLRKNTGTLGTKPQSYTYRDNNIQVDIEFSDSLPLIDKGETEYVHFTITNIGEGFLEVIEPEDIEITGEKIRCEGLTTLTPIGKKFPKITCNIDLDGGVNYLSTLIININIAYNYEIRKSIPITIIR